MPQRVQVSGSLSSNSGELVRDWCLAGHGIMLRALESGTAGLHVPTGDVRELRLPVQVDVLIAELIETWLLDELQIPALNALRANRAISAKTRIIPERYEAFATFGHVDFDCYGFQLPFPLHNWPYLPESTGWQVLPFHPLTEAVKAFELRFNRYSDPNFQMTIRANSIAAGKVNAMRLSGIAYLVNDLTLGATVAFNGDKGIPIEAFDVHPNEPVNLSLSGNWGAGLARLSANVSFQFVSDDNRQAVEANLA